MGFACDTEADVLLLAERSAAVTHNHPEGIKIAQAYYRHVPAHIVESVRRKLPPDLGSVVDRFNETRGCQF